MFSQINRSLMDLNFENKNFSLIEINIHSFVELDCHQRTCDVASGGRKGLTVEWRLVFLQKL